jgi:flagellar assembly factor FliW
MIIKTRDFGEIEIDEKEIVTFKCPILGFDDFKEFIVLIDESIGENFAWLQSTEESELYFTLANPKLIGDDYKPHINDDYMNAVGGNYDEMWLIAVISEKVSDSKVNLKSPIIINTKEKLGAQAISESPLPIRYQLFAGKESV